MNPHEGHPSGKGPIRVPSLLSGSGFTLDGFMLLQLRLAWQQLRVCAIGELGEEREKDVSFYTVNSSFSAVNRLPLSAAAFT